VQIVVSGIAEQSSCLPTWVPVIEMPHTTAVGLETGKLVAYSETWDMVEGM